LSVIPLIKILQLFISLPSPWSIIISYSILLILSIYYLAWFKIPLKLKGNYLVLPLVLILGLLLGIMGKPFLPILPVLTNFSILLILIVVLSEEIFFRGLLQETSTPIFGTALSIIIPALFYSLSHISLGIFAFIYFLAFGLISGLIYASTKNLLFSIILGLIANLVLFVPL
jgi:membrane protease YdiL (CAAX protease family)